MTVYPIFLNNLQGRNVVVFGGNHEAERKALELVDLGANVHLYSAEVSDMLHAAAENGRLNWVPRWYQAGDLSGAFLAIVAEINPEATVPIWEEAQAENVLINAMDDVQHCTFVAGAVVRQGDLVISISTSGAAPTLAVRLRQEFEQRFGPAYGRFLSWMRSLRGPMARHFPDFQERRAHWYRLVDSDVLSLLQEGREDEAAAACIDLTNPAGREAGIGGG